MTFLQLTFAVEVANSTSINKAAEWLYTSQSNVSNSIKALEDELGIKIFDRTKKGISVTEPGREFLSYAREILDKMDFVEDLYKKSRFRQEYFSVSSMRSYFLSYPITRLWPEIEKGYNGHRIYVRLKKQSFNDVMDDVQYGHSDLGIVFLTRAHQQRVQRLCSAKALEYHELGESHISLVMQENHPIHDTADPEERLAHIADYPYVVSEVSESFGRFYDDSSPSIHHLFEEPPKCVISINDSAGSQDIVANSNSFFISSTVWQHPQHYDFTSIPLEENDDNILTHYYILRKGAHHPLTELYIEELKKMFGKL